MYVACIPALAHARHVILYTAMRVTHRPARPLSHVWQRLCPEGQGGGASAEVTNIFLRVLALVQLILIGALDERMAAVTLLVSVSSM